MWTFGKPLLMLSPARRANDDLWRTTIGGRICIGRQYAAAGRNATLTGEHRASTDQSICSQRPVHDHSSSLVTRRRVTSLCLLGHTHASRQYASDSMGLLTEGSPLTWAETKALSKHVQDHGIEQFIRQFGRLRDRTGDVLKWGDEVGFTIIIVKRPRTAGARKCPGNDE